jgi:hypothetical protein
MSLNTNLLWGLETAASLASVGGGVALITRGANFPQNKQQQSNFIGGGSTLLILGVVGMGVSLYYGNTAPVLYTLSKYPVYFIFWLAMLYGAIYGVWMLLFNVILTSFFSKADFPVMGELDNPIMAAIYSGMATGVMLLLAFVFRSAYKVSKLF